MKVRTVGHYHVPRQTRASEALRDRDAAPIHRPAVDAWIAVRLLSGWTPQEIVTATNGHITLRTAYRWRKALVGLEVVELGGFQATFAIRRGHPPARMTAWEKVVTLRDDEAA